jgi:hypothetical protein
MLSPLLVRDQLFQVIMKQPYQSDSSQINHMIDWPGSSINRNIHNLQAYDWHYQPYMHSLLKPTVDLALKG